jgi:MFS transporter, UMF1 family
MSDAAAQPPRESVEANREIPRRAVVGWVLYDLANTIFSMGVVSLFFPYLLRSSVGPERADITLGVLASISYALIFLISPLLGAMTDRARRRMPFLITSTTVCVLLTFILPMANIRLAAVMFILANIAYQAGNQFYDAMLPDVSTPENRGRIGGIGVGVGYLGSFIIVAFGLAVDPTNQIARFGVVAILFLAFSIPCFLWVRERGNPNPRQIFGWRMIRESTAQTIRTLRSGNESPGLLRFLVGRVFYTDAINTVILIMALFTVNVAVASGIPAERGERIGMFVMLFAISFAVAGGFFWGRVADRVGPKRTLNYVLTMWIAVFIAAGVVGIFALHVYALAIVAAAAGIALGGVWAADRPYMLRLAPPKRIGEFYGLYGMVGRFSAITGPATWALVIKVTVDWLGLAPHQGQGIGALTLMLEVVAAMYILRLVSDRPVSPESERLARATPPLERLPLDA